MRKLLKRAKKEHFANLDINSISDNKKFWQIVKSLFSNKVKGKTTIKLVENDEMIDDEIERNISKNSMNFQKRNKFPRRLNCC